MTDEERGEATEHRRRNIFGLGPAILAVLVVMAVAAMPARGAYILYYHAFGDWTVICTRDEPTGRKDCTLTAPPPSLRSKERSASIEVSERGPESPTVTIRIYHPIDGAAVSELWIDSKESHPIPTSRVGEARWRDDAARKLIARFETGDMLVLATRAPGTSEPHQTVISLLRFKQALGAYRDGLRHHGINGR